MINVAPHNLTTIRQILHKFVPDCEVRVRIEDQRDGKNLFRPRPGDSRKRKNQTKSRGEFERGI